MKLTDEQLINVKHKLAEQGVGAKGKMAEAIGCHSTQISLLMNSGYIADKFDKKFLKWMGKDV